MLRKKNHISLKWSHPSAYVIGIITTDGNLSPDGRHISITSKDKEIIENIKLALGLGNLIGMKGSGTNKEKRYFVIQFGNKKFYEFLLSIGLMPAKSKILKSLIIPPKFFSSFLRGCIDGDGSISISKHPESIQPQLKLRLCSASYDFLFWIKSQIRDRLEVVGGWIYV